MFEKEPESKKSTLNKDGHLSYRIGWSAPVNVSADASIDFRGPPLEMPLVLSRPRHYYIFVVLYEHLFMTSDEHFFIHV